MWGAILIKPVHFLWVHHNVIVVHNEETKISTPIEQDCLICDFEFFLYTSETVHLLPQVAILPHQKEPSIKTNKAFDSLSLSTSLRAPPAWLHIV